jgi:hypothetical protein
LISAFLQTFDFQRFLPCVESQLAKHCFFSKIWWEYFYETKCRKNISTKFCSHTAWQVLLKPVAKNDEIADVPPVGFVR